LINYFAGKRDGMLYKQKGNFQKLIRWMAGSWMTANMATAAGCLLIILVSASFYLGLTFEQANFLLILTPVFLVLRMAMNALDGMLSREQETGSVAGEIWNEALDILGDTICYGSLYFVPQGPRASIIVFIILAWAAEFFGVLGKSMPDGIRRHETFLGGKPDRAIWMGLLAIILYIYPGFLAWAWIYISLISIFVGLTSLIRIRKTILDAQGKTYHSYTWIGR
jgi:CDP-diacylglycerol--glycerol-3-phosphate 3-phosphatidyltransferase